MSQSDSAAAPPSASTVADPAGQDADTAALARGGRTNFFGFILRPVSYTHLDVYKRQLIDRSRIALAACPEATSFVVAGGVAANGAIRAALTGLAAAFEKSFVAPPLWLCTDNGAMIAWAGVERFAAGLSLSLIHI